MPKPFDSTMRELLELAPAAWLDFLGVPVSDPSQVEVIDSNVSTVTAEADKVVRIGGKEPLIVHAEVIAGRDLTLLERAHWYNTLLRRRHRVPVGTVVVLLRPAADGPELTGTYEESFPGKGRYLWFGYDVIRVWQQPPEHLLAAGLPILPLAPVSNVAPERLPDVLTAVAQRLKHEADSDLQQTLWAAIKVLMGLNYPEERVNQLTEGISTMIFGIHGIEESSVYQGIYGRGRVEGATDEDRTLLLSLGRDKLGQPPEHVETAIGALTDRERLHQLLHRLLRVSSWDELLASPNP